MKYPGIENKPFYIKFERDWWKKGDIINCFPESVPLKVLKVYKNTWWRRLLLKLGIKVKIMEVKVIKHE